MTRTLTKPPTDPGMWRQAVARAHRDAGGNDALFIWLQNVREHVCNGEGATAKHSPPQREAWTEPPPRPEPRIVHEEGRVPFPEPADFEELTRRALAITDEVPPLYADLLRTLEDCEAVDYEPLYDQQQRGATYKQLAALGHKVRMTKEERVRWYRIVESVPLSCPHAGHILSKLKGRSA